MSRLSFSSLRVRLLLVVLIALVPSFVLLAHSAMEQRLVAAAAAKEQALKFAREAIQYQRQLISQSRRLLGELAQRPELDLTRATTCSAFLAGKLQEHNNYSNFGMIDLDGTVKCSAVPLKGRTNVLDRSYFRKTLETRDFSIGDYLIGRVTGKPAVTFGYPSFDNSGNIEGVVFASLDLSWLNQALTNNIEIPLASEVNLVDQTGTILARSVEPHKWIGKTLAQSSLLEAILAHQREGTVEGLGVDRVDRLYAFSSLLVAGKPAAYIVVGISKDVAFLHANRLFISRLLILVLVAVLVFAVAWYGGFLFVLRQVNLLVRASRRVASGDLSVRIDMPDRPGELNQLARSFNEMAESLERRDRQLNRANRALRILSKCSDILEHATDESELLSDVCRVIVEIGGFRSAWVGYAEEDEGKTVRLMAQSKVDSCLLGTVDFPWADNELGQGHTGTAIRTGRPSVATNMWSESCADSSRSQSNASVHASSIAIPLISNGRPFGALTIYATEADAFDSEEEKLLCELAADLSFGIATLRRRAAHRESEEQFRLLVSSIQDYAIISLDINGRVKSWNIGAERIKGYQTDEIIGEHFSRFFTSQDIEAGEPEKELKTAEEHGRFGNEGWRVRKDGSRFWASVVLTHIRDEAGKSKGFSKVTRDLTERKNAEDEILRLNKELEQRVIERTAQLEAANKELESFSYSVSHDLRAPLRSIDGFSQALLEDYADKLDEEGKDYLARVRTSSQRMGDLIDDMLKLSRVTRGEMRRESVDLTAMVQALAAELQKSVPDREVEFVIGDGLTARGDARLLRIAIDNLLGNAWKYTSNHPHARIEFGFAKNNGRSAYFVRDDGAGFDMAYADKLFGAFQRLHRQTEFSGTGVGLATVQRIMHRHGGRVWAEGEVEKGATFYFTLSS